MEIGYSVEDLVNDYIRESIREPLSDFLINEDLVSSEVWILVVNSIRRQVLSSNLIIYDLMDVLYGNLMDVLYGNR